MIGYKNKTDEQLMAQIQTGDEIAFNEIYQRYSKRLLLFLFKMLGQDEASAQDFLQDVFLKLASHPEKFDVKKNFKTWIFTVTANLCKNHFRTNNRQYFELSQLTEIKDENETGEIQLDHVRFKKELSQKLNQLLPVYKEVFLLRYHEGLSLKEIAIIASCPLGTVKSRLHSATRILSEKLIHYQTN